MSSIGLDRRTSGRLPSTRSSRGHRALALLALVPIVLLVVLLVFLPPDGLERPGWAAFAGRFHSLIVHFPIALILLVPVLELAAIRPRFLHLRGAVRCVLGLALVSAIVAPLLGWSMAWSGAFSGPLATQHMWGGAAISFGCWGCWTLNGLHALRNRHPPMHVAYVAALFATAGLVPFAGYRGGQLAHGEGHITDHLPDSAREMLGLHSSEKDSAPAGSDVGPDTLYGARIQPIFSARCTSCHGANKRRAQLRLDSYAAVMRGGEDGPVVRAGDLKGSELFRRITLSHEHEEFMPAEGKKALSTDEVKQIERWITAGASATLAADDVLGLPAASRVVAEVTIEEIDPAEVQRSRAAFVDAVIRLRGRYPHVLDYESRGSADLHLNASLLNERFGDAELADFAPLAGHIVFADLSGTAVTDDSAPVISGMTRLRALHLRNTRISDATLQSLSSLDQLEVLNIFGTSITASALTSIERLPKLRQLYAAETRISNETSEWNRPKQMGDRPRRSITTKTPADVGVELKPGR